VQLNFFKVVFVINLKKLKIMLLKISRYNFKISLRSGNDIRNGSIISEMTSPDIPGPPTITDVKQIKENVQIDWTAPSQPNGVLLKYVVQLYPINEDGSQDLSVGGGARVWMTETASQTTYLIGSLDPDQKYNFTVKAINTHYTGVASIPFSFVYKVQNKERVSGLEVKGNPSDNSVVLRWKKSAGGDNIEYKVSTKSDNLIALHGDILVNNSVSNDDVIEATVTYLSPNTSYVFGVAVIVDGVAGPFSDHLDGLTASTMVRIKRICCCTVVGTRPTDSASLSNIWPRARVTALSWPSSATKDSASRQHPSPN